MGEWKEGEGGGKAYVFKGVGFGRLGGVVVELGLWER